MLVADAVPMAARLDADVWRAVLAFLLFLVVVLVPGLWGVHKTTGRPYREMLSLLAGAVVLIGFMVLGFAVFSKWIFSPDPRTSHLADRLFAWVYLPIAAFIWWVFNRLAKRHRKQHTSGRIPNDSSPR